MPSMCYLHAYRFGIKYNRSSDPRVSSGRHGIIAPMPDRLVDVLMSMGLNGWISN